MGGLVDYTWKLFGTIEVVDRVGDTYTKLKWRILIGSLSKVFFFGT